MTALALDLGTARTRLLLSGSTAIKERPSSFGEPGTRRWPVRHGMVADMPSCARLVRAALSDAVTGQHPPLERVLLGVPVAASRLDRRAAYAAVSSAARCRVTIVEEPLAAAVGCGRAGTGRGDGRRPDRAHPRRPAGHRPAAGPADHRRRRP
ncbi:rod shape-determining protein [Microbispora rosea]|uniref:rod shape-determining protein n=1 Tax=Microbispora rosea TaxID=58117 RepID=UPI003D8C8B4D